MPFCFHLAAIIDTLIFIFDARLRFTTLGYWDGRRACMTDIIHYIRTYTLQELLLVKVFFFGYRL